MSLQRCQWHQDGEGIQSLRPTHRCIPHSLILYTFRLHSHLLTHPPNHLQTRVYVGSAAVLRAGELPSPASSIWSSKSRRPGEVTSGWGCITVLVESPVCFQGVNSKRGRCCHTACSSYFTSCFSSVPFPLSVVMRA